MERGSCCQVRDHLPVLGVSRLVAFRGLTSLSPFWTALRVRPIRGVSGVCGGDGIFLRTRRALSKVEAELQRGLSTQQPVFAGLLPSKLRFSGRMLMRHGFLRVREMKYQLLALVSVLVSLSELGCFNGNLRFCWHRSRTQRQQVETLPREALSVFATQAEIRDLQSALRRWRKPLESRPKRGSRLTVDATGRSETLLMRGFANLRSLSSDGGRGRRVGLR